MNERFEALAARALDGDLSPDEDRELLDLLRDPAREAAFADWARVDRELAGLLAAPLSDDRMAELVLRDVDRPPGRDSSRFIAVMDRVRRRRPRAGSSGTSVFAWAAAAAAFAALLVLASAARPRPAPKPIVREIPAPVVLPEAAPPPAPRVPRRIEREPEPLVVPPPAPLPAPPAPAPDPPRPAPPPAPTVASVARVERADGRASVRTGQELAAGQGIETGRDGRVSLRFPDGSRVDLAPASALRELGDRRAVLASGSLSADIADRPFNLLTPEAEAAVSGAKLTLATASGLTRVDVEAGRARLSRRSDGAAAEIAAGQAAVASPSIRPVARACPSGGPLVASFTLVDVDTGRPVPGFDPLQDGAVLDRATLPPRINVRANTLPAQVGSVVFAFDGQASFNVQNGPPYAAYAFGDKGKWQPWELAPGAHELAATPHAAPRGGGPAGGALTLSFRVDRR